MTRLDCTVSTCVHNAEKCCCKTGIYVEGAEARKSKDTCCGSFEENQGNFFKNIFKTPESKLHVECDVVSCLYNDDHMCRAEKIAIAGGNAKTAITMILADCGVEEARERLNKAKGHVREAIK